MWEIHKSGSVRGVETLHSGLVQAEIEALGGEAAGFPTDVSRETDVIALVRTTVDRYDQLDILINSAGIGIFRPFAVTTTEEWDRAMAVNARGPFLLCREALPYLKQSDWTTVINISNRYSCGH